MAVKHGLGRGLGALLRNGVEPGPATASATGVQEIPVASIRGNRWQPRRRLDPEALDDLTRSIRERGVLQPLLVRAVEGGYELIAGERRMRAAAEVGLSRVPVIVMEAADSDALQLALIENLQREDLNVLDEAEGYQTLAEEFNLTQDEISSRVGKARASVTNALRLLKLPPEVKQLIADDQLSAGHAKLLTGLDIPEEQVLLAQETVKEGLSVRALEKRIQKRRRKPRKTRLVRADIPDSHLAFLSDRLHSHFGTSVRVRPCRTYPNGKKTRGAIEIDFFSNDDLDRILQLLGIDTE
jgi:ParB family chromosome partitioning protein